MSTADPRAPQSLALPVPRAVVFGCAGPELLPDEQAFFQETNPLGFILFRRNIVSPDQVRRLIEALRATVGRDDAPVLIDQEGGRVARLRPPHWPVHPPARTFGLLAEQAPDAGREAAWLNGRLLAASLYDLGISVDCAPVCDVPIPGAHDVIGDRAFAEDPALVGELARCFSDGLLAGGVLPVIKHIPGHGRAHADSHEELPVVDTDQDVLAASDFVPFRRLADLPLGMVAHVVYRAVDAKRPASTSPAVIAEVVRGALGFDGLLMCDDLSMGALNGSAGRRAREVLAAGCDLVLHCNGQLEEMREVAAATPALNAAALQRWQRALAAVGRPQPIETAALRQRLDALLVQVGYGQPAPDCDPTTRLTLTAALAVGGS